MFRWLIALITFPGIIIHEWAHKFFCDRTKIPVYKTCYFRLGNPAGYVLHGPIDSYWKAFLISTAPLLINTAIAVILFFIAVIISLGLAAYILCWLGISIATHSFPSSEDADNLWRYSKAAFRKNPLALLCFPLVGLMKLAARINTVWFGLLYGVALLMLVAFSIRGNNLFSSLI
jgi:hypothetical protein